MTQLKVINGSFGDGKPRDNEDNAAVVAALEELLAKAKERKAVAMAICLVTADGCVISQYEPSIPQNVFTLYGAAQHVAQRVWTEGIEQ